VERSLAGLLGRLAFATPRAGHWEQRLRALRWQACGGHPAPAAGAPSLNSLTGQKDDCEQHQSA